MQRSYNVPTTCKHAAHLHVLATSACEHACVLIGPRATSSCSIAMIGPAHFLPLCRKRHAKQATCTYGSAFPLCWLITMGHAVGGRCVINFCVLSVLRAGSFAHRRLWLAVLISKT